MSNFRLTLSLTSEKGLTCTFRSSTFVVGAGSDLGQPFCPKQIT